MGILGGKAKYWLILPVSLFLIVVLILPLTSVVLGSFATRQGYSIKPYIDALTDEFFLEVYWRTLRVSVMVTLVCAVLGFPVAYFISRTNMSRRGMFIALTVFPMLTSTVVRTFAWLVILGKYGLVNTVLTRVGIIEEPLSLLYTEVSLVIGMAHLFLPAMILAVLGAMENIGPELVQAAESLGATRGQAFMKIIFPLASPGLVVGATMVLTGSMTAYTTPQLLGGTRVRVLSTLVYQNAMTTFNWSAAGVVAIIIILTTSLIVTSMNRLSTKLNPKG